MRFITKPLLLLTIIFCYCFSPFHTDVVYAQSTPSGLSATISGTTAVCLNAPHPTITFKASGGAGGPFIFTYTLNGVIDQTIISDAGDSATIQVPTNVSGFFTYRLKSVSDVSGTIEPITTEIANITVRDLPSITGSAEICNGGATTQLSASGGIPSLATPWASANIGIAKVDNTGLVTSVSVGNTSITYTDIYGCSISQNIKVNGNPTIDFSFPNNQCSGSSIPFTSSVVETGTYKYKWYFGDGSSSVEANPSYWYSSPGAPSIPTNTYIVSLYITNATTGCVTTASKPITVLTALDPNLTSENVDRTDNNGVPTFTTCVKAATEITFINASTTKSNITTYTIDWGDGSAVETPALNWTKLKHTYPLGLYTLKYTVKGSTYCDATREYKVFIGSNPSVTLGSPGDLQKCITESLRIPVLNSATNPPGTTYVVSFNDGSPDELYDTSTLPDTIVHKFRKGSCGINSTSGNTIYPNAFFAKILASNPCGMVESTVVPIHISTPPKANYYLPSDHICTDTPLNLTNTSIDGTQVSPQGVCASSKLVWLVEPNQDYTVTGTLGSTNGVDDAPSAWTRGSDQISFTFTKPGTYKITMLNAGPCDSISRISKEVCVTKLLDPDFSFSKTEACIGEQVNITNSTDISNSCSTPSYKWTVTYTPGNCGFNSSYVFVNSTTANSAAPSLTFNQPGIYTVTLTTINECGTKIKSHNIIIKKKPQVLINTINDACGEAHISPTASINACAPASSTLSYAWTLPGSTQGAATGATPGPIDYTTPGTYTVSLDLSNECGTSSDSRSFTIKPVPSMTNTALTQTTCSGLPTVVVPLTADLTGTTFSWTTSADGGLFGYIPVGSGMTQLPAQTINSSNNVQKKIDFSITPSLNGCPGNPVIYTYHIDARPYIISHPASAALCKDGTTSPLSVLYTNTNETPSYQWYENTTNNNTGGAEISGETHATYTPSTSTIGTKYYYCIISFKNTNCGDLISNPAMITVAAPPSIVSQPQSTQSLCVGGTLAIPLAITYQDGAGLASYQWYENTTNSNSGGTAIPGPTGTASSYSPITPYSTVETKYYYLKLMLNGAGCNPVVSNPATVNIVADPVVSVQPKPTQTLCQGSIVDGLQITATGGTGTFMYQWYQNTVNHNYGGDIVPGATNDLYIPLATNAGTTYYYCEVTQIGGPGCNAVSDVAEVIVKPTPSFTTQPVSSGVCTGGSPSTLSVAYQDGVGTPSYQWYSNTTPSTATGATISSATSNSYTIPPSSVAGTTYYYCTISLTGGKCSDITSNIATVTFSDPPTISTQPLASQTICVGGTITPGLSVGYTGGTGTATYQWYSNSSNSNTGGTPISGANNASYTPPAFTTIGTYYYYATVSLSGNNCGLAASNPAAITVVADPVINTQSPSSAVYCLNATPSNLFVNPGGGTGAFHYQWYSNAMPLNSGGASISGATNSTFAPLTNTAGTVYYYCQVTQSGLGCDVTSSVFTININPEPVVTTQPAAASYCMNETPVDLHVAYANGVGIPAYQWFQSATNSTSAGTAIPGAIFNHYTPDTSAAGTTYYYCIISFSGGGCATIESALTDITIRPLPSISDKTALTASDLAFSITPGNTAPDLVPPGTTYTWNTPVISPLGAITGGSAESVPQSSISQTLTDHTPAPASAVYTVTPSASGCAGAPFLATVTINPDIKVNATTTNSSCYGSNSGSINTVISGGVPFTSGNPQIIQWTGPNGFTASTANISGLAPGVYTLNVSDNGGFPVTKSYTITEPNEIVITTIEKTDIDCYNAGNGKIAISATGGTGTLQYNWTKDGSAYASAQNLTNLTPGTYEVSVSDDNHCGPKTMSYAITEPAQLITSITSQTNVACFGDATGAVAIAASGGTPDVTGYHYAWSGPNSFANTSPALSGLPAGNYTLTVTDKNSCTTTRTVTITESPELIVDTLTTPISCYGADNASIVLNVHGGATPYHIQWSNFASGNVLTNVSAGTYTATVTDANNCQKSVSITIHEAKLFTINPTLKNVSCYGAHNGSIKLNIQGSPISVQWQDGSTAGTERNNIGPGNYSVTISDGSPCIINRTFSIIEPPVLAVSDQVTNAIDCSNPNSGAIELTVTGGTLLYTYSWSNGATTKDLSHIPSGSYVATVTDANGCSQTKESQVWQPQPIAITMNSQYDYNCSTKTLQQIFAPTVTGGIPPYTLSWSSGTPTDQSNSAIRTSQSGLIILTVTDSRGCTTSSTAASNVPTLGIDFRLLDCNQKSYAFNAVVVDEATENYSYYWEFGDGSTSYQKAPQHTYASAGIQTVKLTVAGKSCTTNYQKIIIVEGSPVLTISPEPVFCKGDSMTLHVSGAAFYKWNNGVTLDSINIKQAGDYSVTGTSRQGCSAVLKVTTTYHPEHTYQITSNRDEVTLSDPSIHLWSEDMTALYYLWHFGDSISAEGSDQTHTYQIKKDGYFDIHLMTINPYGCKSTTIKRVWIVNDNSLNTFTPNGDGFNDIFLPGWHVKIYNRNGIQIFEGLNGWDGTYNGKLVSPDTYFYVVYYMSGSGIKSKEGYVTLIR